MSDELVKHGADVRAWLARNKGKNRVDAIGQSLLNELKTWILAGRIDVEETNSAYFELMEKKYPTAVNRIDWSRVDHYRVASFRQSTATQVDVEDVRVALSGFRGSLALLLTNLGVRHDERVVYVGDGSDIALRMNVETFLECFPVVLEQPQHGYVLPVDAKWCLNYTMECELFIGEAAARYQ